VDTGWNEERVRRLLTQVEPYARELPGGVLGAFLGIRLRDLDPTFHPTVLRDPNLKRLLARFPDIGAIEQVPNSPDFRFRFLSSRADTASLAPGFPAQVPNSEEGQPWMDKELWLGLTLRRNTERRYIDLQTRRVVVVAVDAQGEPQSPVKEEPERYLSIPTLSLEELKPVALEFANKTGRSEVSAALSRQEHWFAAFLRAVDEAGLKEQWKGAHRAWVWMRARQWLEHHQIPVAGLLRTRAVRPPLPQPPVPSAPGNARLGIPRSAIRPLVLKAIARMSDEELLSLSIPLRYLLAEGAGGSGGEEH
jgi:hypothetical protein